MRRVRGKFDKMRNDSIKFLRPGGHLELACATRVSKRVVYAALVNEPNSCSDN